MLLQSILFKIFKFIVRPFVGSGIGRLRFAGYAYRYLASHLVIPESDRIVSINNYKMYVHLDNNKGRDGFTQELIYGNNYEEATTNIFKGFIKQGSIVVDIGANVGYFTLLSSLVVGDKGKVYAFEPEPKNYQLMLQNIKLNKLSNIVAENKAVSDKNGSIEFFVDEVESGGNSIFQNAVQYGDKDLSHSIQIETVSIDKYFSNNEVIDFIKIDVQGAETLVLDGMRDIVKRNDNIKMVIEIAPYWLEKAGYSTAQCWELLTELGFKYKYRIHDKSNKLDLTDLSTIVNHCKSGKLSLISCVNLFCSKKQILDVGEK